MTNAWRRAPRGFGARYVMEKKIPPSDRTKMLAKHVTNFYHFLSLLLRVYELFWLSKCMREWRKLGYSGESLLPLGKLSPVPTMLRYKEASAKVGAVFWKRLLDDVFWISFMPSRHATLALPYSPPLHPFWFLARLPLAPFSSGHGSALS